MKRLLRCYFLVLFSFSSVIGSAAAGETIVYLPIVEARPAASDTDTEKMQDYYPAQQDMIKSGHMKGMPLAYVLKGVRDMRKDICAAIRPATFTVSLGATALGSIVIITPLFSAGFSINITCP